MNEQTKSTMTVSLGDMATRYLDALQKLYDMVCFVLAGTRVISERDYDEVAQQLQIMPRHEAHMEFEHAKTASQQWLLRNTLGDALALFVPLMEDCRTICELCELKAAGKTDSATLEMVRKENREAFLRLEPAQKFTHLADRYDVHCEVQEHVLAFLGLTHSLMTNDGVLSEQDGGKDGALTVRVRSVHLVHGDGDAGEMARGRLTLERKVGDASRVIKVGERITFSKAELLGAVITMGVFVTNVLQGLQAYAQKTGSASDTGDTQPLAPAG